MPDFELWDGPNRRYRFSSDVDSRDEHACVQLLRAVAKDQRVEIKRARLVTWVGRHRHRREYRAPA